MSKTALSIVTPIILLSILAIVIFGFTIMSGPRHVMVGCFGSTPGANCSMLSPIEHFAAHLNAFQSISTTIVHIVSVFAALLLAVLSLVFDLYGKTDALQRNKAFNRKDDFVSPQQIRLGRWLALREKRDPSIAYAMNL